MESLLYCSVSFLQPKQSQRNKSYVVCGHNLASFHCVHFISGTYNFRVADVGQNNRISENMVQAVSVRIQTKRTGHFLEQFILGVISKKTSKHYPWSWYKKYIVLKSTQHISVQFFFFQRRKCGYWWSKPMFDIVKET